MRFAAPSDHTPNYQAQAGDLLYQARQLASAHRYGMVADRAAYRQALALQGQLARLTAAAGNNHAVAFTAGNAAATAAAVAAATAPATR